MRRVFFAIALGVAGFALAGCETTEYTMAPSTDEASTVSYDHGVATVASDKENSTVKVTPIGFTQRGRIRLAVAVLNKSNRPANLGYENVELTDELGNPLHKLDRNELVRIAKQQAAMAQFAVALSGAAQAYSNAYASQSTTYGYVGNTSFSATTYNPALNSALNERTGAQTGAALTNINLGLNNVIASLNGSILQTTTVQPNQFFGGEMIIDKPPPKDSNALQKILVHVNFAGDQHEFHFDLAAHQH